MDFESRLKQIKRSSLPLKLVMLSVISFFSFDCFVAVKNYIFFVGSSIFSVLTIFLDLFGILVFFVSYFCIRLAEKERIESLISYFSSLEKDDIIDWKKYGF